MPAADFKIACVVAPEDRSGKRFVPLAEPRSLRDPDRFFETAFRQFGEDAAPRVHDVAEVVAALRVQNAIHQANVLFLRDVMHNDPLK